MTKNPLVSNPEYSAPTNSIVEWGNYLIPGLAKAPEYAVYVDQTHAVNSTKPVYLNETQVLTMFEYDDTWFGLNNTYNAKLYAQIATTDKFFWTGNQTAFLAGMEVSYGLNETEMLLVYDTFTEMIAYLNGGSQGTYKNRDLITGFYSTMAERICDPVKANFLKGDAIYYNPFVTPSITNFVGPQADATLTIFTGNSTG